MAQELQAWIAVAESGYGVLIAIGFAVVAMILLVLHDRRCIREMRELRQERRAGDAKLHARLDDDRATDDLRFQALEKDISELKGYVRGKMEG